VHGAVRSDADVVVRDLAAWPTKCCWPA